MNKGKGYYSGNSNILQTLVDTIFDTSVMFFSWLFDGYITKDHNFKDFFKNTGMIKDGDLMPILKEKGQRENCDYYLFQVPTGMCLKDFERQREQFSFFFHADMSNIKFIQNKYDVEVQVYKPNAISFQYETSILTYKEPIIPIGVNLENNKTVCWRPCDPNQCHMLIGGSSGSGKSVALNNIIAHLIEGNYNVELILQDTKMVDLYQFKDAKQVKYYNEGLEYAEDTVKTLCDEMSNRYKWLREKNKRQLNDYKGKDKPPYIFYVIEELASFIGEKEHPEFYKYLGELLAKGRAAGIFIIISTQAPYSSILPGMLKNNINAVLGMKTKTRESSKVVCGDYDKLFEIKDGKGHGYLFSEDEIEIQCFNISDEQIERIVENNKKEGN